jgi:hypothetical protein
VSLIVLKIKFIHPGNVTADELCLTSHGQDIALLEGNSYLPIIVRKLFKFFPFRAVL